MTSVVHLPGSIVLRRGGGRPFVVAVVRRDSRRRRRVAARMSAAGRPVWWIARALRVARGKVDLWLGRAS
jgi:hypothetical protein